MLRAKILQVTVSAAAALITAGLIAFLLNASDLPVWIFVVLPAAAASVASVCKPISWVPALVLGSVVSALCAIGIVVYAVSKI
jgi:hypothetical protein